MAGELEFSFKSSAQTYALIRSATGQIWHTTSGNFQNYATANFASYPVSCTEQGTASAFYTGNFPTGIISGGVYNIVAKQQIAGSPAESDPTIAVGVVEWNGSTVVPLANLATSGQVGQFLPVRIAHGVMVRPFPFKLVSSVDHVTPFTSGVISGQISKDGGNFGPLQSGAFSETGMGWYTCQALTSGDLNCNTAALLFTAVGVSGGTSDQRDFAFITQKTSGY